MLCEKHPEYLRSVAAAFLQNVRSSEKREETVTCSIFLWPPRSTTQGSWSRESLVREKCLREILPWNEQRLLLQRVRLLRATRGDEVLALRVSDHRYLCWN